MPLIRLMSCRTCCRHLKMSNGILRITSPPEVSPKSQGTAFAKCFSLVAYLLIWVLVMLCIYTWVFECKEEKLHDMPSIINQSCFCINTVVMCFEDMNIRVHICQLKRVLLYSVLTNRLFCYIVNT